MRLMFGQSIKVIDFHQRSNLILYRTVAASNITPNLRKQATPNQLWADGIQTAPPIYAKSIDQLDIVLGEHHSSALSHEGLRFEWLQYADDGLENVLEQFGKKIRLDFVVSPDNLGHIQVKHPKTGNYFPVRCTRPDYAEGLTLYQHRYIRKSDREVLKASPTVDTASILKWLEHTDDSAVLVVSRDGYMDWAWSSTRAFKAGAYFKTTQNIIEIPVASLAANTSVTHDRRGVEMPAQVWFPHADKNMIVKEMKVVSDQYDCIFTILRLPRSEKVWAPWKSQDA